MEGGVNWSFDVRMKTLQIHFGSLHPTRAACVAALRAWFPCADHMWIDEQNCLWWVRGMNAYLGINREWPIDTIQDRMILSDRLKFYVCATVPDLLYIDTDVLLLKKIELDPNCLYYGESIPGPMPDICIMYNGQMESFGRILRESITPGWIGQTCSQLVVNESYQLIPYDSFIHFGAPALMRKVEHDEKHWWNI